VKNSYAMTLLVVLVSNVLAPSAPAQAAGDPWAEVPALPTSCYRGSHEFEDAVNAATDVLQAREAEQKEINAAIELQYNEVDIMERQQHLMKLMAEDPERAQQYIQNMQQGAMGVREGSPEMSERQSQFDAELKQLRETYDAELQQALGPVKDRQAALGATLAISCNGDLLARAAALQAEQNRAYEGFCANWWSSGPVHDWFARFKRFKNEEAALWDQHAATQKLSFEMAGVAADQYRSTDVFRGAMEYLRRASEVFFWREFEPVSEELGTCEVRHG